MKTPPILRIAFGLLVALSIHFPLTANAAFITDKIVVEVRTERFGQGSIIKRLPSGTSVEVLNTDGKYTRVRTTDNITGWINSTFITNKKPTQLEYLELLRKSRATEMQLLAAEKKLASSPTSNPGNANNEEIEALKNEAKNARWMKVEMMKARDQADQAKSKLKAELKKRADKNKKNDKTKQQLETLRTKNKDLEQRLAAAMLVSSEEQQKTNDNEPTEESETEAPAPRLSLNSTTLDSGWTVNMEWFFGSLISALILGFIAGMVWLDNRSRQRHGGFRIY